MKNKKYLSDLMRFLYSFFVVLLDRWLILILLGYFVCINANNMILSMFIEIIWHRRVE